MILPDLFAEDLRAVFCGTAASSVSAQRGAYYAGPGNRFWPTLFEVGVTPRLFAPTDFPNLLSLRLGLTDLAKHASGQDIQIRSDDYDVAAFWAKIERWRPELVVFTSKTAARLALGLKAVGYGPLAAPRGEVYVLPSPSGAARGAWDIQWWRGLGELLSRPRLNPARGVE